MMKTHSLKVSTLLCGALTLLACTSGESRDGGKAPETGGGTAGAAAASPAGGSSGYGGAGMGGTGGVVGTPEMDASEQAVDVALADVPTAGAIPDLAAAEASTLATLDTPATPAIDSDGVLRGYQVYGNELMAFELCGTSELIWMNLTGWEKGLDKIPAQGCPGDASPGTCVRHLYTELNGVISPYGQYGHMSKYTRKLDIQEFLLVTLTESPTCPFLPPVYPN